MPNQTDLTIAELRDEERRLRYENRVLCFTPVRNRTPVFGLFVSNDADNYNASDNN